ncbi:MAG: hypothetical protein LBE12_06005 [Planctomycetaceae bacterium]|nr:hypothetical protein [Planctomycetaceae bacterium]
MKHQYRYFCPNCDEEGYVCKALFKSEQTYQCNYCGAVLVLRFNSEMKEFDAEFYFLDNDD